MDSFYTTTPVLALATGFFSRTDALVTDTDVIRGMQHMIERELPWSKLRQQRQRQIVCWYDRMSLKTSNTARQNVDVIQAHIDALDLSQRSIIL